MKPCRKEGGTVDCPYCGDEMQAGFVRCRDGVRWSPKKPPVAALAALVPDSVVLGGHGSYAPESTAVAYNCSSCKMVVIPYEG